jgi:DNA topoisomerase I
MRTDSIRLSDVFVNDTKKYIASNYGKEYIGYAKVSKKKENVQDAHEAIRPTNINRTPESIKKYLKPEEYKLYNLIYLRALCSLMADAKVEATSIELLNNEYTFKTTGQVLVFDGYLKVYKDFEDTEDNILPSMVEGKVLVSSSVKKLQHFTEPKPRFTEASLIAELEKLGIGRPSTYSKIVSVLKERKYVNINERKFFPTEVGITVTDKLQEFFSSIINVNYTANMETELDEIAENKLVWYEVLDKFYKDFEPLLKVAFKEMEKESPKETGEICPNCGNPLVIRKGRYGEFTACSNYPECKYIKKEEKKIIEICKCPKCGGMIIEKKTRKGKIFYGCNNYPKCNYALWDKPTGDICNTCGGLIVERKDNKYCPECNPITKKSK